jgi:hypothetical protein
MIYKEARKASMDPAQEKLRQSKAAWNKDVSAFLNDVIHFKKLMNGWPSKYFKERSKIILPIPADPATIVNSLASQFQELAQRGSEIAQQQTQYSQSRRQKRTDQATQTLNKLDEKYGPTGPEVASPLTPIAPAPTGTDLTKQLGASWEDKYQLVAEGSNPFSRFFTTLTTPRAGFGAAAQKRRLRMDLLKAALKAYRGLGKLQVAVSKSGKESIVEAHKVSTLAWSEWKTVASHFNVYMSTARGLPPGPDPMPEHAPPEGENVSSQPTKAKVSPLPPEVKPVVSPPVATPPVVPPVAPEVVPPTKRTNPPIIDKEASAHQLESVSQAFLQKWLGRMRHQVIPGSSSGIRLQIFDLATNTRQQINEVMDLLEKDINVEQLESKISDISRQMNTIRTLIRALYTTEKPSKGPGLLDGMW